MIRALNARDLCLVRVDVMGNVVDFGPHPKRELFNALDLSVYSEFSLGERLIVPR